jgi:hypothetical protein
MENCPNLNFRKGIEVVLSPKTVNVTVSASPSVVNPVEISAHLVQSKSFLREASHVFQNQDLANLIVISTMQHARQDMVSFGDEIEQEKERLLLVVLMIAFSPLFSSLTLLFSTKNFPVFLLNVVF